MDALTLYELNSLVRNALESKLAGEYWLQAELSEVREGHNGHCYLEFIEKDEAGGHLIAKSRGTIWSATYRLLKPYFERETGRVLAPGLKVLVRVSVSFHELYGYSLTVTDIDPVYTMGDMARRRKEILQRLEEEGVEHDNKDLPLPGLMNRIAVISSEVAAGYGDFCDQLYRNDYGFRFQVRLFPAAMQGERVEESVLAALDSIMAEHENWDVVVITRGGGATSDLSGFDTYLLAAACAQFPIPVITGIGHERDDTVLDMVAHTRVKTPTAAAAFIIHHQHETAVHLKEVRLRVNQGAARWLAQEQEVLKRVAVRIPEVFSKVKLTQEHQLEGWAQKIRWGALARFTAERQQLSHLNERLRQVAVARTERERFRLNLLQQRVAAADPMLLLKRGYSLTYCDGKLLRSVRQLQSGEEIITRLADGEIRSTTR